ncbi:MAG: DNA-binding protein [Methanolinea sp.]|jgi:hypothetical protein|nr:DNA-binding protein [Methanolinea sp.]
MVRTDTSIRLMGLLLDGKPVTDRQLADAIGFKNPRNIAKHLDSFASSGYIRMLPHTGREESPLYQLTDKKEGLLNLYQSRFYRVLRPRIREIDWFIDQVAAGFLPLPKDLFDLVREMMKKSHTFFSLIAGHSNHDQILSFHSLYLFPCRLMGRDDPLFQAYYLYAQLYAEAITRDIREGGLSEGFLEPLDAIQKAILQIGKAYGH